MLHIKYPPPLGCSLQHLFFFFQMINLVNKLHFSALYITVSNRINVHGHIWYMGITNLDSLILLVIYQGNLLLYIYFNCYRNIPVTNVTCIKSWMISMISWFQWSDFHINIAKFTKKNPCKLQRPDTLCLLHCKFFIAIDIASRLKMYHWFYWHFWGLCYIQY